VNRPARLLCALVAALLVAGCASRDRFVGEGVIDAGPGAPIDIVIVGMDTEGGLSTMLHDLVLTFEIANNTREELTVKSLHLTQTSNGDYEQLASSAEAKTLAPNDDEHFPLRLRARYVQDSENPPRRRSARAAMRLRVLVRLDDGRQVQSAFEIPVPLSSF
jgi:hypothetical protein